jgi:hypothetical protein
MPIKCGKGHSHDSIAEVKACYGVGGTVTKDYRENQYPGNCRFCGTKVEPKQGRIDRTDQGWQVAHLQGQCPPRPARQSVSGTVPANDRYAVISQGHYATPSLTGHNDLDFWRVDRPSEGPYAGKMFVKRIVGGKPEMNVKRDTKFRALEAILELGVDAAALLYGRELGRCSRCNRHLTDEISRQYGKGPECRSKG